jgi:hypothetical protein
MFKGDPQLVNNQPWVMQKEVEKQLIGVRQVLNVARSQIPIIPPISSLLPVCDNNQQRFPILQLLLVTLEDDRWIYAPQSLAFDWKKTGI